MSEARIGRVLVASLHQGIADILPSRLEFYENWLNSAGLRHGTIGLAPFTAVLSFLRREGDVYELVTNRAGEYSAIWTVTSMPRLERMLVRRLPLRLRTRAALRVAAETIGDSYPGSRAIVRMRRGAGLVEIRGSLFCEVREAPSGPLCGFYSAVVVKTLELFRIRAVASISRCRAMEGRGCIISLAVEEHSFGEASVA
jgi:hypothetical protein